MVTLNVANCRKSMTYGNLTGSAEYSLQVLISTSLDLCRDFLEIFPDIQTESINLAQPEAAVSAGFFARKKKGEGVLTFL